MKLRMLSTSFIFILFVILVPFGSTTTDFFQTDGQEYDLNKSASESLGNSVKESSTDPETYSSERFQLNDIKANPSNFTHPNNEDKTISFLNSSFYNPGDVLSIDTVSTYVDEATNLDWSTEGFENSYYYYLTSPQGETWFNSSTTSVQNATVNGLSYEDYTYRSQNLNSSVISNFTSFKVFPHENFVKNVSFLDAVNITPTVVKITFKTEGKAIGAVSYNSDNGTFTDYAFGRSYINGTHTIYLKNLNPGTIYYFALNATDIFGNIVIDTNNGSYYSFTTGPAGSSPTSLTHPYVKTMTVTTSELEAIIDITIASGQSANVTVYYDNKYTDLSFTATSAGAPGTSSTPQISISGLAASTKYYFRLLLVNDEGNFTLDNNDNQLYVFTTKKATGAPNVNSTILAQQVNSTFFSIEFTTSVNVSSSIQYATTYDQVLKSPQTTSFNQNNYTHFHLIPITGQVTTTFFGIRLSGNDNATITNFNNSDSNYYTFNSEPFSDVPQNRAYINVTLELPTYPAELGYWHFNIQIVKNNTDNFAITKLNVYETEFLINNSLTFTPDLYLLRRGFVLNGSDVFGNYLAETVDSGTVFSPGDNISIIGQLKYSDNSIINSTDIPITGTISLVYENETISIDGKIYSLPVTQFNLFPNKTTLYNGVPTYFLINFEIPSKNIYGDVTIETRVEFPGNNSFIQVSDFTDITVKYLLGLSEPPQSQTYYFTERLAGSITVTPYHWDESLFDGKETENAANNYSRVLDIPASEIDLDLITKHNGNQVNILQIQKGEYSWFWLREHLDFEIDPGNYSIEFIWNNTGLGIPKIETVNEINSFTDAAVIYNYTFSLEGLFKVDDLTRDLVTLPNKTVSLRFKVVVNSTGISLTRNHADIIKVTGAPSGVTIANGGTAKFSTTTAEYSIKVTIASGISSQTVNLTVLSDNTSVLELINDPKISFTINSTLDDPNTNTQTSPRVVDEDLSFTDWLFVGGAAAAFGIYVIGIYFYFRRK